MIKWTDERETRIICNSYERQSLKKVPRLIKVRLQRFLFSAKDAICLINCEKIRWVMYSEEPGKEPSFWKANKVV